MMAVRWIGGNAVKVAYRVNGGSRSRLLTRSNEALLSTTAPKEKQLTLDEDGASFRLASEAFPIRLRSPVCPESCWHAPRRESRPHRVTALCGEMMPRQPLWFPSNSTTRRDTGGIGP